MRLAKEKAAKINRDWREFPDRLRAHIKHCYICTLAGDHVIGRCDEGWELTKAQNRNRHAKYWLDQEQVSDVMDPLFPIEEVTRGE